MKLRKYSVANLKEAVNSSDSIRECLIKLNVTPYGGNYIIFKKAVKHFCIDISHFTGKLASSKKNKGRSSRNKIPLDDILQNKRPYGSNKLRIRLLSENIFPHKCSNCELTEWMNQLIPLELDHIDGDNMNNSLDNLRMLCPNCHAQTSTYCGKNKSKKSCIQFNNEK